MRGCEDHWVGVTRGTTSSLCNAARIESRKRRDDEEGPYEKGVETQTQRGSEVGVGMRLQ